MFFKHDDNKYKIICSKLMFNVMPQPPFFGEHLARDQKCAVQNSGTIFFVFLWKLVYLAEVPTTCTNSNLSLSKALITLSYVSHKTKGTELVGQQMRLAVKLDISENINE